MCLFRFLCLFVTTVQYNILLIFSFLISPIGILNILVGNNNIADMNYPLIILFRIGILFGIHYDLGVPLYFIKRIIEAYYCHRFMFRTINLIKLNLRINMYNTSILPPSLQGLFNNY